MAEKTTKQRERQGVVVSDAMDKTVVVASQRGKAARPVREGHSYDRPFEGS